MKDIISFIIILFLISLGGIIWGIYEFQTAHGLKTAQTLAMIKVYITTRPPKAPAKKFTVVKKPPEPKSVKAPEEINPPEQPVPEEMTSITPVESVPITPTKIELRRTPKYKPEESEAKTEADLLIEEANKYYDTGIIHVQNTFKKDETFDKENDLAIEKFRQALAKYLEAEKKDPDNLWLRMRIRETNGNLVTCRKQARRK